MLARKLGNCLYRGRDDCLCLVGNDEAKVDVVSSAKDRNDGCCCSFKHTVELRKKIIIVRTAHSFGGLLWEAINEVFDARDRVGHGVNGWDQQLVHD